MKIKEKMICIGILAVIVFFASCSGTNKEVSNKVLKEDLQNSQEFSRQMPWPVKIADFEVTKRQTRPESGEDTVWVSASVVGSSMAEGVTFNADMSFKMVYELYNDGWQLYKVSDCKWNSWEYTPIGEISTENILEDRNMPTGTEILGEECDLEAGIKKVKYTYRNEAKYYDYTCLQEVEYCFDKKTGRWTCNNVNDDSYYWLHDLKGTWTCKKMRNDMYTGDLVVKLIVHDYKEGETHFDENNEGIIKMTLIIEAKDYEGEIVAKNEICKDEWDFRMIRNVYECYGRYDFNCHTYGLYLNGTLYLDEEGISFSSTNTYGTSQLIKE